MQMKRILLLLLPTLFAGAVRAEMPRFADRMPAAPAATAATAAIPAATPETESAAARLGQTQAGRQGPAGVGEGGAREGVR